MPSTATSKMKMTKPEKSLSIKEARENSNNLAQHLFPSRDIRMDKETYKGGIELTLKPYTLPESASLPSVKWFAECFFRALGKELICRVLKIKHSANKNTR